MALNLKTLVDNAKRRGLMGVVIVCQGLSLKTPYLARCLDRDGRLCDPSTWDTHATPEGALIELSDALVIEENERKSA